MLGIYIRKSRDHEGQKSIKEQKLLGIECAEREKLEYRVYDEGIVSGADISADRPQFKKMAEDIKRGMLTGVFIWETSRAARNTKSWLTLADLLGEHKVLLYDNGIAVDLSDPQQYMFYTQKASYDEFYTRMTSKKIKTVLKRNAKENMAHGCPPLGYMKDEKGRIAIDPEEKKIVEGIFADSLSGVGLLQIAKNLTEQGVKNRRGAKNWASATVSGIIKNPYYKGERHFSGNVYEVPAIFEKSYWQKVNNNLTKNRIYSGKGTKHKYLLPKGMVICGSCGKNCFGRKASDPKYGYYMCSSRIPKHYDCENKPIKLEELETYIWGRFFLDGELQRTIQEELERAEDNPRMGTAKKELAALQKQIDRLEEERKRAIKLVIQGKLSEDDIEGELKRIDRETADTETVIGNLNEELTYLTAAAAQKNELTTDIENIKKNLPFNERQRLIKKYIKQIIVLHDKEHQVFQLFIYYPMFPNKENIHILDDKLNLGSDLEFKNPFIINERASKETILGSLDRIKGFLEYRLSRVSKGLNFILILCFGAIQK